MKTLLLVAGQSKRFWPLTEKPLFPVVGKPLMQHVIDRLERAGCGDIIFIGSKNNLEEITRLYPDAIIVEQEKLELGMRGALLSSLPQCGNDDILIVGSNDIIESSAYHATVEAGRQEGRRGAILAQSVTSYFPGGYLSIDNNRITGIVEKPGEGNEPSNLVNIVCHYHSDASVLLDALKQIDDAQDDGYGYEKTLDTLFKTQSYVPVPFTGTWQAVKYPWHLLKALPMFLDEITGQHIDSSADIHTSAVIDGHVIIEEGVRIMPGACIKGPCFIGRHTIIGNNALVRGSSIGEHCVIGYNTEVKSSVLHSHVWTHSTYIGDSVVGENVSFGAGSVTGNLRLDEMEILSGIGDDKLGTGLTKFGTVIGSHSRIGIHVGINPGIKIGSGTFVSSGSLVDQDLKENTFARMKGGELILKENTAKAPIPAGREKYRSTL